ncbi:YqaJ viral recombinase family protein [Streptomyces sp. TRM68367]|nr:YqaJ viral recombinase family protein [Streptomyces sp. TRM68367]
MTAPTGGLPDAPTARLLLPRDASEEQWLEVRRTGIGGSDMAAILGLDKRRGPRRVYEEKHGYSEPENSYMRWGRKLEPLIAEGFEEETGLTTAMPPGTLVHLEHSWALANVDRYVLDGHVVAPLECKSKSEYLADEWEDSEEAPDGPALQAHWYTAVGGWSHSYVAALLGGNRLTIFRQERNEELIKELFAHAEQWYQRHIVEGFPPPVDGLESTKELLAALWEVRPEAVAEIPVDTAKSLRAQRADLKARVKALEAQLVTVENQMRDEAKDAEIVKSNGTVAWTWKQNGNFSATTFREQYPELAAQYVKSVEVIDTDRLKTEHKDIYRKCRGRRLLVPAKGL